MREFINIKTTAYAKVMSHPSFLYVLLWKWETGDLLKSVHRKTEIQYIRITVLFEQVWESVFVWTIIPQYRKTSLRQLSCNLLLVSSRIVLQDSWRAFKALFWILAAFFSVVFIYGELKSEFSREPNSINFYLQHYWLNCSLSLRCL